jgi:hypothetical protein
MQTESSLKSRRSLGIWKLPNEAAKRSAIFYASSATRRFRNSRAIGNGELVGQEILAFLAKVCIIFSRLMKRTSEEVANTIEGFVSGTGRQWDWDGFTSIRIDDPELEAIRQKCIAVRDEFPPEKAGDYCSPAGMEAMRKLAGELRAHATA